MKSKNKKITIYQVAQRAGVAISTVSRVLNNSPNVSEKTKEKVNEAISELNFRPQVSARKLASREPQMLAIAVPSFTTPYYNEVLKGVKDEIQDMDLDIVIYNTGSKNPKEGVENFFDRGTADAVITISIDVTETVHQQLQSSEIPVVLIGSSHPSYNYFELNNQKGGFLAGEHLIKQGFSRLGMIKPVSLKCQLKRNSSSPGRAPSMQVIQKKPVLRPFIPMKKWVTSRMQFSVRMTLRQLVLTMLCQNWE
jgi:LacI family transcriptional regulator